MCHRTPARVPGPCGAVRRGRPPPSFRGRGKYLRAERAGLPTYMLDALHAVQCASAMLSRRQCPHTFPLSYCVTRAQQVLGHCTLHDMPPSCLYHAPYNIGYLPCLYHASTMQDSLQHLEYELLTLAARLALDKLLSNNGLLPPFVPSDHDPHESLQVTCAASLQTRGPKCWTCTHNCATSFKFMAIPQRHSVVTSSLRLCAALPTCDTA